MLVLLLMSCGRHLDYEPHAAATRAVCAWAPSTPGFERLDATLAGTYPSEACVDAVLADFGVATPEFLDQDGLVDPYGAAQSRLRLRGGRRGGRACHRRVPRHARRGRR